MVHTTHSCRVGPEAAERNTREPQDRLRGPADCTLSPAPFGGGGRNAFAPLGNYLGTPPLAPPVPLGLGGIEAPDPPVRGRVQGPPRPRRPGVPLDPIAHAQNVTPATDASLRPSVRPSMRISPFAGGPPAARPTVFPAGSPRTPPEPGFGHSDSPWDALWEPRLGPQTSLPERAFAHHGGREFSQASQAGAIGDGVESWPIGRPHLQPGTSCS